MSKTIQIGAKTSQPPRPQEQDSPTANFGRYGLFRALLRSSTPKLQVVGNAVPRLGRGRGNLNGY